MIALLNYIFYQTYPNFINPLIIINIIVNINLLNVNLQ